MLPKVNNAKGTANKKSVLPRPRMFPGNKHVLIGACRAKVSFEPLRRAEAW